MNDDIIQVSGLNFDYGKEPVLQDITLNIKRGSFSAVLGRNGSGKSTLARQFNAICLPCGGKVYTAGLDTSDTDNIFKIRSLAGMVFQNPDNQIVAALVEDEAAFAPENLGVKPSEIRRRVDKALRAVGLENAALKATSQLSGGQKQRLAIAAVLTMEPELMIFDEATAMLDPRGRKDVMNTVRTINRIQGTSVVYITHYMEEAAYADRVIVMDKGRIIMDGTPPEIFVRTDELTAAGLDVPQATQIAHELRKAGINIRADILSMDELYLEILNDKT